ncbi:gp078R [Rabbit fibroma virus]|uniref:Core protein D3 homolog n=1 Tax=Rabbit fibroma virus (strain Kasza) TaxID=10272 RepID=D3_RFVKA|nr:gp078R [Rabbit fibroma virus]P25952.1 RecName: Full=Core protein D3 homolog; AltName: Full=27 kDa virion core protein [Rabbit fibroma virus (strain Kasza)]AAA47226.1 D5R ORF [Rabbit fibroma virus]AAF17960.1 gp078R [Rabbit fibroma virus]
MNTTILIHDDDIQVNDLKENKTFLLLSEHNERIIDKLCSCLLPIIFYCDYITSPDDEGTLETRILSSSYMIRDKYVNVEEFITAGLPLSWCVNLPEKAHSTASDSLIIRDVLYYKKDWIRILLIQCPSAIYTDEELLIDPFKLPRHPPELFKNVTLRSYVNGLLFYPTSSPLYALLSHVVTTFIIKHITCVTKHDEKLITTCYDKGRFNAFVYAWYNSQISDDVVENEKVKNLFALVKARI